MIQIGFSRINNNPLSWFIRKITKAQISHTWLLIDDPFFGIPMVLQASTEGFVPIPLEKFQQVSTVVNVIAPKISLDNAVHDFWKKLGTGYSYEGLVGMSWVELGRIFNRQWNNPLGSKTSFFCSQVVVLILQAAGYPGIDALNPVDTGPEDLYNFLIK